MSLSPPFPSLDAWLRHALRKRGIPQSEVAGLLRVDRPLFSRYVRGDEQIPRFIVGKLAQELEPEAYEYLLCLKDCEDFTDAIHRGAVQLAASVHVGSGPRGLSVPERRKALETAAEGALASRLTDALLARAQSIQEQKSLARVTDFATASRQQLADIARALDLVQKTVDTAYTTPLLLKVSVPSFRFPINHFVGTLLELDTLVRPGTAEAEASLLFREKMLENLRRTVWGKHSAHPLDVLACQFSTHVLSRHGETDDRHEIEKLLRRDADATAPLLRRLSFTGLLLGRRDQEIAERFVWGLRRDRALADQNLFFNAFHYGDLTLRGDEPVPRATKHFDRSIPNILRHLEHPEAYQNLLQSECVTLTHVLQAAGRRSFQRPQVTSRLRALVNADSAFLSLLRPSVREDFLKHFRPLLTESR